MKDQAHHLHEHGTVAFTLPPGAITGAAKADLAAREHNRLVYRGKINPPARRYAFVAKHVRKAKTPVELLRLAQREPKAAKKTTKVNTWRIYEAQDSLRRAIELAA